MRMQGDVLWQASLAASPRPPFTCFPCPRKEGPIQHCRRLSIAVSALSLPQPPSPQANHGRGAKAPKAFERPTAQARAPGDSDRVV